jgi:hypothetical protein
MNSITHFVFLKNIVKKDIDKIKTKSPQLKSPCPLVRTRSRNKSIENFVKFQWSWTL